MTLQPLYFLWSLYSIIFGSPTRIQLELTVDWTNASFLDIDCFMYLQRPSSAVMFFIMICGHVKKIDGVCSVVFFRVTS